MGGPGTETGAGTPGAGAGVVAPVDRPGCPGMGVGGGGEGFTGKTCRRYRPVLGQVLFDYMNGINILQIWAVMRRDTKGQHLREGQEVGAEGKSLMEGETKVEQVGQKERD